VDCMIANNPSQYAEYRRNYKSFWQRSSRATCSPSSTKSTKASDGLALIATGGASFGAFTIMKHEQGDKKHVEEEDDEDYEEEELDEIEEETSCSSLVARLAREEDDKSDATSKATGTYLLSQIVDSPKTKDKAKSKAMSTNERIAQLDALADALHAKTDDSDYNDNHTPKPPLRATGKAKKNNAHTKEYLVKEQAKEEEN